MKNILYVLTSMCFIYTTVFAEENPFKLSNIALIQTNTQLFLAELHTIKERQEKQKALRAEVLLEKIRLEKELEKKLSKIKIVQNYIIDNVEEKANKIIYLTFDDGPLLGTDNVLKVLQEEEVNATMFFVGKHIKKNRRMFNKALATGTICVANHTYSHANERYMHFYSNLSLLLHDVAKTKKIIGRGNYLRLAGRNIWRLSDICKNDYAIRKRQRKIEIPKYNALMDEGYQIYGWDVEWEFNHHTGRPSYGVDRIYEKIEQAYLKGTVVQQGKLVLLSHDNMFRGKAGANKLRTLIQRLKKNHWIFQTLESYDSNLNKI